MATGWCLALSRRCELHSPPFRQPFSPHCKGTATVCCTALIWPPIGDRQANMFVGVMVPAELKERCPLHVGV